MKNLFVFTMLIASIFVLSACSVKTAAKTPKNICVGCENLPSCVPGPYGDCINK